MTVTAIITCVVKSDLLYVREALKSVKRQTHPCRILVVVTEETSILGPIIQELGIDVETVVEPLHPCGINRNIGVQKATTEWVAFLDADDLWEPEKIERQLAHASQTNRFVIASRHTLVRENGTPFFYALALKSPMPSSWMVNRELMLAEPFRNVPWEDVELWRRLQHQTKTVTLKNHLMKYRVRSNSLSSAFGPAKRRKEKFAQISEMYFARVLLILGSRLLSFFIPTKTKL